VDREKLQCRDAIHSAAGGECQDWYFSQTVNIIPVTSGNSLFYGTAGHD
jgi:hypothetical protein